MASLVHSPVPTLPMFLYGSASDPPSLLHDLSSKSVTPIGITKPCENPPNTVLYIPSEPGSDPSSSDYPLLDSSGSSDNEYYKQRPRAKEKTNKRRSKTRFSDPIKKCVKITAKLIKSAYKSKVIKFKLY